MEVQAIVLAVIAIIIFVLRKDLRNEMLWAGLISIPILSIKPLVSGTSIFARSEILFYISRIIAVFAFSAIASAIYKVFLHKKITPVKHPKRHRLIFLLSGLVLFCLLYLLGLPFITAIISGLVLNIIIVLVIRHDLIWDMAFSGLSMGILYLLIYALANYGLPGDVNRLWFTDQISGITFLALPIEEIFAVILFGALWGPIYIAIKDLKER